MIVGVNEAASLNQSGFEEDKSGRQVVEVLPESRRYSHAPAERPADGKVSVCW